MMPEHGLFDNMRQKFVVAAPNEQESQLRLHARRVVPPPTETEDIAVKCFMLTQLRVFNTQQYILGGLSHEDTTCGVDGIRASEKKEFRIRYVGVGGGEKVSENCTPCISK